MTHSEDILKARAEEEKDIRRQHIIKSAEAVMLRVGLSKLSISAVAKEAKLAQGTLYLYFKKKEDIIAQLTVKSREELLKIFQDGISQSDDPLQQIRNILYANLHFYQSNKLYHDLVSFYEANSGLEETPILQAASQKITNLVVSVLENAKQQGLVKASLNTTDFAFVMWGTSVGMVQLIEVKHTLLTNTLNSSLDAFYNHYVDVMVDGITA